MLGLGQDGFAGIERRLAPAELRPRPTVVNIARVQQRDERAGINDGAFGHEIQARRSLLHRTARAQPPLQALSHDVTRTFSGPCAHAV